MKFQSEDEIIEVLHRFENCTIRRSEWRHREHLTN